ncbi:aminoacyl-histidine dipeptidase [Vallitalea okinawensis]|uniref:aminoacyl-histidine dipeptidase n=1 Tax=Vallitalea okinawensis TaxID=2078660 RepID=UPI000CFB48EE|nr:aminoacyl-histidine dipeptidase [Vallitalea okinawensis]
MILSNLEPKKVFAFFEELSSIPRGSGNEKRVSDFLVDFAKNRSLEVIQDHVNNVIIKKPATKGYEKAPTVIFQGHMDMVCEKNNDTEFDFQKDPLNLKIVDDYITADGTTLGADNGIAVAYAMAILDDNELEHPSLEIVITTDEETGMTGASNIDLSQLKGKYLINCDNESEGTFIVGCAGGAKTTINLPIERVKEAGMVAHVAIRGLKGGHSGEDINKNRGNSNKLMGRILYDIAKELEVSLVSINGGSKDNAIPREMDAILLFHANEEQALKDLILKWNEILKGEFAVSDPELHVDVTFDGESDQSVMNQDSFKKVIQMLMTLPSGIQTMSSDIEGLVESSLNLGVVISKEEVVKFILALRSSKKTRLDDMLERLKIITELFGGEFITRGSYPAWEYKRESELRELFKDTYKALYNQEPNIKAIHAGLECGIFSKGMKDVDIVSLGPDMEDIHTPDERLSISSTARVYEFLVEVLKRMA